MSVNITITCDQLEYSSSLPMKEMSAVMNSIDKPDIEIFNNLFDISGFGESKHLTASDIRNMAGKLCDAIKKHDDRLPYRYLVRIEQSPNASFNNASSDMLGVVIGGSRFTIECGVGECALMRIYLDSNNHISSELIRDLRRQDSIMTDNHGLVSIIKKRFKSKLLSILFDIERFASQFDGDRLCKIMIG